MVPVINGEKITNLKRTKLSNATSGGTETLTTSPFTGNQRSIFSLIASGVMPMRRRSSGEVQGRDIVAENSEKRSVNRE